MQKTISEPEVLTRAIAKAVEGGWKPHWPWDGDFVGWDVDRNSKGRLVVMFYRDKGVDNKGLNEKDKDGGNSHMRAMLWGDFIWDWDFHKALWGEAEIHKFSMPDPQTIEEHYGNRGWKYHLQQMVIARYPLEYINDNI